jgi:predicted Zn-dependent protease with MMP-like domain
MRIQTFFVEVVRDIAIEVGADLVGRFFGVPYTKVMSWMKGEDLPDKISLRSKAYSLIAAYCDGRLMA